MGYDKYLPSRGKNNPPRSAKDNRDNFDNGEGKVRKIITIINPPVLKSAHIPVLGLEEYIDMLDQFSFENVEQQPPRPPFDESPERGRAWAAWWSAIDRRNRKFKVGRWEPPVSSLQSTAIANSPNDEPDTVPPVPATDTSPALPEQLSLTDLSENESPTDNGQPTRSECWTSKGPRRGTPVVA